jgi:hypothetical protein
MTDWQCSTACADATIPAPKTVIIAQMPVGWRQHAFDGFALLAS